jgi:hypothetical protein
MEKGLDFEGRKHIIEDFLPPRTRSKKVLKRRLIIMNGVEEFHFQSTMTIG